MAVRIQKVEAGPVPENAAAPSWLGRGASAVYSLASLASLPSRAFYGTLNTATGGKEGFGNLDPFDANGGVEASHLLVRAGLLPKNDETKWEPADFERGLADAVGDPTSWVAIGGLTRAGTTLAKHGALATGRLAQVARGERALLNLRTPLGHALYDIGTGPAVAKNVANVTGTVTSNPIVKLAAKSAPVQAIGRAASSVGRTVQGLFDPTVAGATHPDLIDAMRRRTKNLKNDSDVIWSRIVRMTRELAPLDEAARKAGAHMTPSQMMHSGIEGVTNLSGHVAEKHANELRDVYRQNLQKTKAYGVRQPSQLHDPLEYDANGNVTRELGYSPRGTEVENKETNLSAGATRGSRKRQQMFKGFHQGTYAPNGVNDVIMDTAKFAHSPAVQALPTSTERVKAVVEYLRANHAPHVIEEYTRGGVTKNRFREIAQHTLDHPELQTLKVYANDPLADSLKSQLSASFLHRNGETAADSLAQHIAKGTKAKDTQTLKQTIKDLGYSRNEMLDQIGQRNGIAQLAPNPHPRGTLQHAQYKIAQQQAKDALLDSPVDVNLVNQLRGIGPKTSHSPAEEETFNTIQQLLNWFKGGTLMFPASRVRDIGSGAAQNVLHGMAGIQDAVAGRPSAYSESKRMLTGEDLLGDYTHVPEVQAWFQKTGLAPTPANQTEAIRQLMAVHIPREHGILGDLPLGQRGFKNEDLLANVPGQHRVSMYDQFIGDPLRILTGRATRNPSLANSAYSWDPGDFRGVGGRTTSGFRPAAASDVVSESGDKLNRGAGFLHGLLNGMNAQEAARRVNAAQIDYAPHTFTPFERRHLKKWLPFYSFGSRIVPVTARQLADFGSPTSQLLKAQSRAYGGNPAVPDFVLDSSAIPLGQSPDGTLHYMTNLGLMHEPAVKMLGQGIEGARTGDFRKLGTSIGAMVNPFVTAPIEQMLGASFSREGEPIANMDSNTGRLLSNLGAISGLRPGEWGPVKYPMQGTVDTLASMTPLGRFLSTLRTATDTRRGLGHVLTQKEPVTPLGAALDIGTGALPLVSGVRYYAASPEKQVSVLRKRAEEKALEAEGRVRNSVYFPKDVLERMRAYDPEQAARMEQIQRYINGLRAKGSAGAKERTIRTK